MNLRSLSLLLILLMAVSTLVGCPGNNSPTLPGAGTPTASFTPPLTATATPTSTPTLSATPTGTPTITGTPTMTGTPTATPTLPVGGRYVYYTVTSPNCGSASIDWQSDTAPLYTYSSLPWTSPTYILTSGSFYDVTGNSSCTSGFTSITANVYVNGSLRFTSTVTSNAGPSAYCNGSLP